MKRSLAVSAFTVTALALLVCGAGFAQQTTNTMPSGMVFSYTAPNGAAPQEASFVNRAVKNAPYSAKLTNETTRTLADGTHITTKSVIVTYRDSAGRTRTEVNDEIATINDPVNGATYRLNMKQQTASTIRIMNNVSIDQNKADLDKQQSEMRNQLAADVQAKILAMQPQFTIDTVTTTKGSITVRTSEGGGESNPPEVVKESLGTQTMEGLVVEGTRITRTIAVGEIGNDRPITSVTERWYSPDLQLFVTTRTSDPRSGETVIQYTELQRGEPDASLFQIPANYKVVAGLGGRGGRND